MHFSFFVYLFLNFIWKIQIQTFPWIYFNSILVRTFGHKINIYLWSFLLSFTFSRFQIIYISSFIKFFKSDWMFLLLVRPRIVYAFIFFLSCAMCWFYYYYYIFIFCEFVSFFFSFFSLSLEIIFTYMNRDLKMTFIKQSSVFMGDDDSKCVCVCGKMTNANWTKCEMPCKYNWRVNVLYRKLSFLMVTFYCAQKDGDMYDSFVSMLVHKTHHMVFSLI